MTKQTKKCVFTSDHFNSNDGMLTSVWGPSMWLTLHMISFNYPVKPTKTEQKQYYDYFVSLGNVLPCGYCRNNYSNNLKQTKFSKAVFKNRNTLSRWVYKLHNQINKMLGKPKYLTYVKVREQYENFRARCNLYEDSHKIKSHKKESGCVDSLYGLKSKCVLMVVPKQKKCPSFYMDPMCSVQKL